MSPEPNDRHHWIEEIAFLEARLNGSQGEIDKEDRAACEEAVSYTHLTLPTKVEV